MQIDTKQIKELVGQVLLDFNGYDHFQDERLAEAAQTGAESIIASLQYELDVKETEYDDKMLIQNLTE